MSYISFNPNPRRNSVGDCVIRAISKVTNQDWDTTYLGVALQGYIVKDMPSSNNVWGGYLYSKGFNRYVIPNTCPDCYTIKDFCKDNPKGTFLLATGTHAVSVIDGNYYDTWDSGDEVPIYYWRKET
jgi:hypothetical protein